MDRVSSEPRTFGRLLIPSVVAGAILIVGCGLEDGSSEVGGVVYAPHGELAAASGPGLLARLRAGLESEARAMTGLERVTSGVEVRLERLDDEGSVEETLVTEETDSDGIYAIPLSSEDEHGSRLIVRVGSGDTRMRGFVSDENVDISPTSEVTVRLVLDSDYALANFAPGELRTIEDAVAAAADAVDAGDSIETAIDRGEDSARDDETVTEAIRDAGAST